MFIEKYSFFYKINLLYYSVLRSCFILALSLFLYFIISVFQWCHLLMLFEKFSKAC